MDEHLARSIPDEQRLIRETREMTAPQLDGAYRIEPSKNISSAIQMAVTRKLNGVQYLWTCRQIGVNRFGTNGISYPADRLGVEWFQIQVTPSVSLANSGRIYDPAAVDPKFYYMPSLVVNTNGDMLLGFSGSSTNDYVGAYYWGRLANGTTSANPIQYFAGKDWLDSRYGDPVRWGDYSHTTLDPDGLTLWTIQEYAETRHSSSGYWWAFATRIIRVSPY